MADSGGARTEPAPQAPRSGLAPATLIVLGGLSAFGPLSTDMYLPGLPAMARDLGVRPSVAQLSLSACLIGLAFGQLLAGPVSDALGRRRPLIAGLLTYIAASALCAAAPGILPLLALRFVQGVAGAAGIAIARAIVRDRSQGIAAARAYSLLMVVSGLGPIVAPVAGGLILRVTDWRGVFVALTIIGAVMLAGTLWLISETLPAAARQRGGLPATRAAIRVLLADRRYVLHGLAGALGFSALFTYIASSPFVLERIEGLSPQAFSLVFATNGIGILIARQLASRRLDTHGPSQVMRAGLTVQAAGGLGVLASVTLTHGLFPLLALLFIAVASMGAVLPMATALAMDDHPERAGAASGLFGFLQFITGSAIAPLAGVAGPGTALPMALIMPACSLGALLCLRGARA
jgi:DHA1 family bicyclomycin/chloramphenicol resistance-like MFS transporter